MFFAVLSMDRTNYTGTDPHNATRWLVDLSRTILLSRSDMLIVRFVCELIIKWSSNWCDQVKNDVFIVLKWLMYNSWFDKKKEVQWYGVTYKRKPFMKYWSFYWHLQSIVMHWCIYLWLNCLSLNILLSYSHIFVILCNDNISRINYVYVRRNLQYFAYAQTDLNRWHQGIFWSPMSVNILV